MQRLLRLSGLTLALSLAWLGLAWAQAADPNTLTPTTCAYNTALPVLASGQAGYLQCDSSGRLIISGGGSSGAASQTATNGSDSQATSATNQQTVSWLYIYNGTSWDRLRGTGGAASVSVTNFPSTQAVSGTVTANQGTAGASPWPTTDSNAAQTITPAGTAPAKSQGVQSSGGALLSLDASTQAVRTALGSPFQANSPISNTGFNALQGGAANASGNPFFAQLTPASAIIGKVGIDQTTPGTTNGVFINGSSIIFSTAYYNAALQSLTSGSPTYAQVDKVGNLKTSETGSADPLVGITPTTTQSGTTIVPKASAGNLYSIFVMALAAPTAQEYLVCVNATAAPSSGATITPVDVAPIGQGTAAVGNNASINYGAGPPNAYSTGIACVVTTSLTTYTPGGNAYILARAR